MTLDETKNENMLDLESAIKHCEEVTKEQERQADFNKYRFQTKHIEVYERQYKKCTACASEHRQLAEWLRELKAYRKAEKEIEQELVNWDDIDNGKCRGLFLATSIIQHYKNEEVNADGDSD